MDAVRSAFRVCAATGNAVTAENANAVAIRADFRFMSISVTDWISVFDDPPRRLGRVQKAGRWA
jgi:hypothetical protein